MINLTWILSKFLSHFNCERLIIANLLDGLPGVTTNYGDFKDLDATANETILLLIV